MGPATGILVLAAGCSGHRDPFWGSIRILRRRAPPPDLEELDMRAQGGNPLMSRKKMLLRALKDLENEQTIGKLETDDFEPIAAQYRAELKTVLTKIDEASPPTRAPRGGGGAEVPRKAKLGTPKAEESEPDVTDERASARKRPRAVSEVRREERARREVL